MRVVFVCFFIALFSVARAQTTAPAAGTDLRVVGAFLQHDCTVLNGESICGKNLHLRVDDGKQILELASVLDTKDKEGFSMPALGTYKALLIKNDHKKPFHSARQYELTYPDGSTERFEVIGEFLKNPSSSPDSR